MSRLKGKISLDILVFSILFIIYFFLSIYLVEIHKTSFANCSQIIMIFSWLGVFQLILTFHSIRRIFGKYFCLYSIFYLFLFVFSYGQFIMWAFGIHYVSEMTVSTHVRYIDEDTVVRIQIVSLQLLSIFHIGALIAFFRSKVEFNEEYDSSFLNTTGLIAPPMLIISGIINYYISFSSFQLAGSGGYLAIFDVNLPEIAKYLSYMFIPSIYLNLVVSNFSKRAFKILTIIFAIYAIPLAITGDRGSWIYFLGPWVWVYFNFVGKNTIKNNKTTKKKYIKSILLLLFIIYITSVFVSVRGVGYSTVRKEDFEFTIEGLYQPFVKPFFEMGQSARILGIIIQDNLNETWCYGNTFIADILGMILPRFRMYFGYYPFYVEDWISRDYLQLTNYGVGFSSFAEAYLNGGVYMAWFYMLIFGRVIGGLLNVSSTPGKTSHIKLFVALSATTVLGPCVRATMDLWLREFFWGVLLLIILNQVVYMLYKRRLFKSSVGYNIKTE